MLDKRLCNPKRVNKKFIGMNQIPNFYPETNIFKISKTPSNNNIKQTKLNNT